MILKVRKSKIKGKIDIPGSKSHTIRALFFSSLADGISEIYKPLISSDTISAVNVCKSFGADININKDVIIVKGFGRNIKIPEDVIDVGNSGTTLAFAMATAGLAEGYSVFTGDYQIRRRPLGPLMDAMNNLGAEVFSTRSNGCPPAVVKGKLNGGKTELDGVTSQYLSSLLINMPLADNDTEVLLTRLNEVPYAQMTLWWLDKQGIIYDNDQFRTISIKGGQNYKPFKETVPGDFSSATFFMVLAAVTSGEITMRNLDMNDPQGDKAVLSILENMGAKVSINKDSITIKGNGLKGMEIDMNAIPDALPAMAVAGCFAEGETRLVNVLQARLKETDRIHVMCKELQKMGANISEMPDGLIIRKSRLKGCELDGHGDHRIIMALAVAGMNCPEESLISTAEAINVTFPDFVDIARKCGGLVDMIDLHGGCNE